MNTPPKLFYQDEDQTQYFINKASILCAQCMMESLQTIKGNSLFFNHSSSRDRTTSTPQDIAFFYLSSEEVIFKDLYTRNLKVLTSYFFNSSPQALFESIEALVERTPWHIEGSQAITDEHRRLIQEDHSYKEVEALSRKRNELSEALNLKSDYDARESFSKETLAPAFKELLNKCRDLPPRHLFLVDAWGQKLDEIASFASLAIASIKPISMENEKTLSFEKPPTVDASTLRHMKR